MSTERRELHDWEKAECAALKAALVDHNARLPKGSRLTQEEIAHQVGMSQGTLGSHLNGHRPVTQKLAVGMAKLLGVPISKFSTRLANDISEMAEAVGESFAGNPSQKGSGDLPPARSYSMTHEEVANDPREVVMALFIIASRAATLGLSPSQAKTIIRIRNEIVHSLPDQHSALPSNLDGIAAAAFKVSEEGGVSDDLMSMLKHGLSKQSHREQAKDNVRHKKSRTERN
jgi:DNA-binding XRE family transcriptional regulator